MALIVVEQRVRQRRPSGGGTLDGPVAEVFYIRGGGTDPDTFYTLHQDESCLPDGAGIPRTPDGAGTPPPVLASSRPGLIDGEGTPRPPMGGSTKFIR
ncbi:hypothetical protein N9L68_06650 [bacterium]|nr:hypothetical protein [bacterium]